MRRSLAHSQLDAEAQQEEPRHLFQDAADDRVGAHALGQVMREQLEHLTAVARTDQAVLQIMPFSGARVNPLMYGTIKVMTFAEEPPVVYTETAFAGQLIEDPAVVVSYSRSYDRARADALSPEASLAFVDRLLEEDYTP